MRKILIGIALIMIPSFLNIFADAKEIKEHAFIKDIMLSKIRNTQPVKIILDESILNSTNEQISNINVYDTENNQVPFQIFFEEQQQIKKMKVIETISAKAREKAEYLIDENITTSFKFDGKASAQTSPSILIDFGEPIRMTRINIFENQNPPKVKAVTLRGGLNKKKLKTILSQRSLESTFDLNSPAIQFLEISFKGIGIEIEDIKIFKNRNATIYFEAQPEKKYRFYYGNPKFENIRYERLTTAREDVKSTAQLARQRWNRMFPEDFDGDGIKNENDNCPFDSNPMQQDKDEDGVGDLCDNAPAIKNVNQNDTDFDKIGDVIDNCKLVKNPDQKDKDKDGLGDACDDIEDKKSLNIKNILPKYVSPIALAGGLIAIIITLFFLPKKKK